MTILVKLLVALFLIMTTPTHAETKTPYIYILGVAQDAGFPQAGCYKLIKLIFFKARDYDLKKDKP